MLHAELPILNSVILNSVLNKSSAVAKMAAQCCTSWIFTLERGHLSLTHIFSAMSENSLQIINYWKLDSLGNIYVGDITSLTSTTLMQFAAKATEFGDLVQIITATAPSRLFKVTSFCTNQKPIRGFL